jgi:septation ring formation regulator EzrA
MKAIQHRMDVLDTEIDERKQKLETLQQSLRKTTEKYHRTETQHRQLVQKVQENEGQLSKIYDLLQAQLQPYPNPNPNPRL